LISGFKTENDKLVSQIKHRETEESQRAAKFYDKEEKLNKELNRLRNIAGIDPVTDITYPNGERVGIPYGKSEVFSSLRADLEKDTYIEHLREKLQDEQVEYSKRIKELQGTIEKLRVENKRLDASSKASAMSTMELMELKSSAISSQTEKRKLHEEIDRLKEKLRYI
jgi:vacuolar-type H+-ATPase subunit I/STV1